MSELISMVKKGRLLIIIAFLSNYAKAQHCTGCTTVITSNTSANITAGSGVVVCIAPGVTASGNITLNGGVLCNEGTVTNLTLIEGKFFNRGVLSKTSGNLNISNAKNLRIECYANSSFDVVNAMHIDALTNADSIVINVEAGAKFSIGKNVSITQGWLKITNAIPNPASRTPGTPGSFFNIGGQLNVSNSALKILNYNKGTFNITNSVNLDGKYNKKITNYGLFNCGNSFNISGNGQSLYSVLVDNNGTFNITGNLTSAYNNGTVTINNNNYPVKPQPTFVVGKSISISKDNNIINNNMPLSVGLDISMVRGALNNYSSITARDFDIKFGVLTNNGNIIANRDLIMSNVSAVVNNNNSIRIAREFNSKGTVNFGKKSVMLTQNFTNLSAGNIYGPANLLDSLGQVDSSNYALIDITGYSDNNGNLRQYLIVYDENFSGSGIALDDYHGNTSRLGMPLVIIGPPPCFRNIWTVVLSSNPLNPICVGSSVVLTANAFNGISLTQAPVLNYFWLPASITTIPPINTFNTGPITANSVFTVNTRLKNGCVISKTISIIVSNLAADAGPDKAITLPSVQIGGTPPQTGGVGPYTYSWAPNLYFYIGSNNTQSNPNVIPPSTTVYTLTVTDSKGCTAKKAVIVYISQLSYAVLKKELDGGYFDLTVTRNPNQAGKLHFKFEEEYLNNGNTLNCTIIKMDRTQIPVPSLAVVYKDNRYTLNLGALSLTSSNTYYILEVIDKKGEKTYLRFKY